jgi:hypothetical protein
MIESLNKYELPTQTQTENSQFFAHVQEHIVGEKVNTPASER